MTTAGIPYMISGAAAQPRGIIFHPWVGWGLIPRLIPFGEFTGERIDLSLGEPHPAGFAYIVYDGGKEIVGIFVFEDADKAAVLAALRSEWGLGTSLHEGSVEEIVVGDGRCDFFEVEPAEA